MAVGQFGNGTWTDLADGNLVVKNQISIGAINNTGALASGAAISIGDSDTGLKQMGDGQLAVFTNNAEKMRILANGNVGIGTITPSEKLEVAGNLFVSSPYRIRFGAIDNGAYNSISQQGVSSAYGGGLELT